MGRLRERRRDWKEAIKRSGEEHTAAAVAMMNAWAHCSMQSDCFVGSIVCSAAISGIKGNSLHSPANWFFVLPMRQSVSDTTTDDGSARRQWPSEDHHTHTPSHRKQWHCTVFLCVWRFFQCLSSYLTASTQKNVHFKAKLVGIVMVKFVSTISVCRQALTKLIKTKFNFVNNASLFAKQKRSKEEKITCSEDSAKAWLGKVSQLSLLAEAK